VTGYPRFTWKKDCKNGDGDDRDVSEDSIFKAKARPLRPRMPKICLRVRCQSSRTASNLHVEKRI